MARKTHPLTDTQIKAAKPRDKDYSLFDGGGMYLLVKSNNSKIWRFKYTRPYTKKGALISFGSYPEVSLQQARKQRDEARELIKQGVDPQEHKAEQEQRKHDEITSTFKKVAADWFKVKSGKGLTESTLKRTWESLELHLFPYIGDKSIFKLKAKEFIKAMEPLRANGKLETIKRLCQRINEIMFYAVNIGLIDANPAAKIKDAFESPIKGQMPTINAQELPQFMQSLAMARIELQTRCLIEWQLLTMTRPNEAVGAKWQEIDLDNCLWVIPAEKMKMRREHTITLNKQAMAILSIMKPISGHREHIFPSMKPPYTTPMNSSTANMAIKRMGYKDKLVAHGLRALASTILNEQGFDPNIIEAALAHVDTNSVRRAYNRATYLEQRRIMLDWWGDFVEQASQGNVSLSGNRNLKLVNH
ncbi:integrase [Gilliamella apicola]|uniref:integrase domain-containing protein n=1 Tax=Gilliamella TaxID=1193503 RepID=UPI000810B91C|nr:MULTISPECIES: integrase domain-containing protein [Gilliamella]MCO6551726.1 tyrosine-type recombinase/integrase [Gilliamella sp.]MCO6560616.1 tyrosine-type recombinase/integrase [Gilliamella sp.]MWN05871.1 tyrosine-type recombinase/integrase [Gilliamella sp. Pas-s95]OCF92573.1 integrase [Gilliamella apicola]OTP90049.1 integrase [Gilliamella apicola]